MIGIHEGLKKLFSYEVNLDRRVRRDNPLRAIREKIDFAWVRHEVGHHYGYNGNESTDPVVILKLLREPKGICREGLLPKGDFSEAACDV